MPPTPTPPDDASTAPAAPRTLAQALNEKIRELLQEKNWSQREFARQLGVSQGAVSYMLATKRRAGVLDFYETLAAIFGVKLSVLIADLEQRIEGVPAPARATPPEQHRVFFSLSYKDNTTLAKALAKALVDVNLDERVRRQVHNELERRAAQPRPDAARPATIVPDAPKRPKGKKAASVERLHPEADDRPLSVEAAS